MIHYTLLPREEMKELRKEYRIRLFIVASFFLSIIFALGLVALLPSYVLIHLQEKDSSVRMAGLQKSDKESGADKIERDLAQSQIIADKIIAHEDSIMPLNIIQNIVSHRPRQVILTSFDMSKNSSTTTPWTVVIQGKASTRDVLLDFKKELEEDMVFSQVELPLSELAKNKNISFGIKVMVNEIKN